MNKKAQSLLEYIFLIGIVTMALFAMNTLFKRGIQGIIKVTADQIGNQQGAEQSALSNSGFLINGDLGQSRKNPNAGYLVEAYSATKSNIQKNTRELDGAYDYIFDDRVDTFSNSLVNLGFTNKE